MSALTEAALPLLKIRLNRKDSDTLLDNLLNPLLDASVMKLEEQGIYLQNDAADVMMLVDYAHWRYSNRDKPGAMPQWLSLQIRERWLSSKGRVSSDT